MSEHSSRPLSPKSSATAPSSTGGAASASAAHGAASAASSSRHAHREPAHREPPPLLVMPVAAADEVAQMALHLRAEAEAKLGAVRCDACDVEIEGEPAGSGLFMWSRGDDDPRFEEPPLCTSCATAIGATALRKWDVEDEEEG